MQWHLAYHVEAAVVVQAVDWFHEKRVEGDMLDLFSCDFLIISKENKTSSNPGLVSLRVHSLFQRMCERIKRRNVKIICPYYSFLCPLLPLSKVHGREREGERKSCFPSCLLLLVPSYYYDE